MVDVLEDTVSFLDWQDLVPVPGQKRLSVSGCVHNAHAWEVVEHILATNANDHLSHHVLPGTARFLSKSNSPKWHP